MTIQCILNAVRENPFIRFLKDGPLFAMEGMRGVGLGVGKCVVRKSPKYARFVKTLGADVIRKELITLAAKIIADG